LGENRVIFQKNSVNEQVREDYPMNTNELVEAMVQQLGTELKRLLEQVHSGQLPASAVETAVRQKLWHFGGQAVAVLLEGLDQTLVGSEAGSGTMPVSSQPGEPP
jgi:hypothetical protein